jgi:type VI secretion system protein ImpH
MAGETGPAPDPLAATQEIEARPYAFDFFEAMRRIECAWPTLPRLGDATLPQDEPVRLGHKPSLDFAPSMLASVERIAGGRLRILGYFFGLFGPQGPLPLHLTEYVHDRMTNARDDTLAAFADVFHHRMLSLFYRAWADARPTVQYDRPDEDAFAEYVAALIGIGQPTLRDRDDWPDRAKLYFAGLLAASVRTRAGLEAILTEYLGLSVRIDECVGEWLDIEPEERMRLGDRRTARLGMSVLGERVYSAQHRIRIVIGPVNPGELLQYLPGGASLRRLRAVVLNYLGLEHAWDVQFVVRRARLPALRLGAFGHLGWTGWLAPSHEGRDASDVIIEAADAMRGAAAEYP